MAAVEEVNYPHIEGHGHDAFATSNGYAAQPPHSTTSSPAAAYPETIKAKYLAHETNMMPSILNGHSGDAIFQSHPMTLTLSGSSLSSVKEEDATAPTPYGTRSRNRPGSRPNYSEDAEVDFDFTTSKLESASSKHSTPSEQSAGFCAINVHDYVAPQIRSSLVRDVNSQSNTSSPAALGKVNENVPEKKKRKYERTIPGKSGTDVRNMAKDLIPGTSQFHSAAHHALEQPPAKKRKTSEGHALKASAPATGPSAGPAANSRKATIAHVTRQPARASCTVSFERKGPFLNNGKLEADDGTIYAVDDCVYLICEPPGEPYYLARIMEFRQSDINDPRSPVTSLLVNWFYRPKDIQRYSIDPRCLFASMQSDESPITSLRGKCYIQHRSEIDELEDYRKRRDSFWYNQLYDRYIQRPYEMVPAAGVINVPEKVKKAINDRWKFLVVEPARMKELTSAVKVCKRCSGYCAPNDSVDCGVCRNTYHMTCVRPPLVKKPSRGFAWSCGPCSRAQEKKLEQRHAALLPERDLNYDDEVHEEEEEEPGMLTTKSESDTDDRNDCAMEVMPATQVDIAQSKMWPWRYLGIHCRVEDVLQYDDRAIYPRATSRLGPKYQVTVQPWNGRPIQLVKPIEIKKKFMKGSGNKKDAKFSKETLAALEAEKQDKAKRPRWVQDEPPGYVARGEDYPVSDPRNTAQPLLVLPSNSSSSSSTTYPSNSVDSQEMLLDAYMERARSLGTEFGLARDVYPGFQTEKAKVQFKLQPILPTNYLDKAIQLLAKNDFDPDKALIELRQAYSPKDFGDPDLTKDEMRKFEEGVGKHGSELRLVRKHVKTRAYGEIVRTYYSWKKSERGQEIWSQHGERRHSRKRAEVSWTDIADDEDDSAFDNEKSASRKRRFQCKFCLTRSSKQWRRAPNVAPNAVTLDDPKGSVKDKANQLVVALCQRCAVLWRKYAMRWEDPEEVAKSLGQSGGRAWKRKVEEEILRECVYANEAAGVPISATVAAAAMSIGVHVTHLHVQDSTKKKLKITQDKDSTPAGTDTDGPVRKKEKEKAQPPPPPPRPPTPPIEPQMPKWRQLPCAVCLETDVVNNELLSCRHCKLTVHRRCYAIPDQISPTRWVCDTCVNDKHNEFSLDYKCVLCPVNDRKQELLELPRVTHKKKNDRDREKERLEKKLADDMVARYQKQQLEKGRSPWPREAVKKTASNNWMHLVCAIWTPEVRFSEGDKLESAEATAAALTATSRADAVCKLCKIIDGGCVQCHQCHETFHVACAHEAGYRFGFDITPVKGSRKDMVQVVSLGGETGYMTAAIWCKEHVSSMKTIAHGIHDMDTETSLNALQTFVRKYKQADRTLTGTARKANMFGPHVKAAGSTAYAPGLNGRRTSILVNGNTVSKEIVSEHIKDEGDGITQRRAQVESHQCVTCSMEASPQWRKVPLQDQHGLQPALLSSSSVVMSRSEPTWQCHRCFTQCEFKVKVEGTQVDNLDEDSRASLQPDYFELTAPRPFPLQLLGPWSTSNPQSRLPVYASGDPAHVEQAQRDLNASTIIISNQAGESDRVLGRVFGKIEDIPVIAWRFFGQRVADELGFDERRHAFLTEDGFKIFDGPTLTQALARLLCKGNREVSWRIIDHVPEQPISFTRPPSSSGFCPPPSLQQLQPRSSAYPPRATLFQTPAARAAAHANLGVLPPLHAIQSQHGGSPLTEALSSTSSRSSPYFSHSPAARPALPAALATGSISPPRMSMDVRRSTTPRDSGVPPNGASSSPNLKNLVH